MKVERKFFEEQSYIKESLCNICRWWCETYPKDIFVSKSYEIVEIRKLAEKILEEANV